MIDKFSHSKTVYNEIRSALIEMRIINRQLVLYLLQNY